MSVAAFPSARRALLVGTVLGCSGCNLALGVDDQEAVPPNCGTELELATSGLIDVRTGHCYSVVSYPTETSIEVAGNDCVRQGGYLACINDLNEFNLLSEGVVPTDAWLGNRFEGTTATGCEGGGGDFDVAIPIWGGDDRCAPNEFFNSDSGTCAPQGAGCTSLGAAQVEFVGCGNAFESAICEFELAVPE